MLLFSIGRIILPDSKFKEFLKKKFRKQISADTNKKLFGIATNRPQQTKESVDYTLKLLERCCELEGNVIECGVYRGGNSFQIAKKLKELKSNKTLYALDTFEGHPYDDFENMPKELQKKVYGDKGPKKHKGETGDVDLDQIKKLFAENGLDNTIFLEGLFIDTFKDILDQKFCFAYVDADFYLSVKQCIEFLKDRLIPGGIMVFDDYNCSLFPGCNRAVHELLGKDSLNILTDKTTTTVNKDGTPIRAYWIKPYT
jgi:hypothetical protein|tara:strand:+ start:2025 stop:2792 length:768 start_codon:yes stop_codon:yes gene_type:complete